MDQLLFLVVTLITAGVGAYFGAYLKEKGKSYAIRKGIAHLTRLTEEVRSEIASKSWIEQRRWDLKKDLYIKLIDGTVTAYQVIRKIEELMGRNDEESKHRVITEWESEFQKLFTLWCIGSIFLAKQVSAAFSELTNAVALAQKEMNAIPSENVEERRNSVKAVQAKTFDLINKLVASARDDLLLESEKKGAKQ